VCRCWQFASFMSEIVIGTEWKSVFLFRANIFSRCVLCDFIFLMYVIVDRGNQWYL
jgi:hypothetical protein